MPLVHRRTTGKTLAARKSTRSVRPSLESLDASLAQHQRALLMLESAGDHLGAAATYLAIGDLVLLRGEAEQANEMYRRSLAASRRGASAA